MASIRGSSPKLVTASLYVFSGVDGGGKSTQIDLLVQRLRSQGVRTTHVWSRGGYTPGFNLLKRVLRAVRPSSLPQPGRTAEREQRFRSPLVRKAWLTLAVLDLLWLYGLWLRLLKWGGKVVICDRYLDDTGLDFRLNLPDEQVERWLLWRLLVWLAPRPDAAFLFLVPVEESLRRSRLKYEPFPDSPATLQTRLEFYERLAAEGRWTRLDGLQTREQLHAAVCHGCGL